MKIHKLTDKDYNYRYLCDESIRVTIGEFSQLWKNVTCSNCLRKELLKK